MAYIFQKQDKIHSILLVENIRDNTELELVGASLPFNISFFDPSLVFLFLFFDVIEWFLLSIKGVLRQSNCRN